MIPCETCGTKYNDALMESCPLCEGRALATARDSDLAAAQNPETSEDTLGKLAMDSDPEISAAALANPNTPQWAKNRLQGRSPGATSERSGRRAPRLGVRGADDWVMTSTTSEIVGYRVVESLGVVFGTSSTVNKSSEKGGKLRGGWVNTQDGRMAYAVEEATERMLDNARRRNANAVVGVSIAVNESEGSGISSWRSTGAVVSGTAVSVVSIEEDEVTSLE